MNLLKQILLLFNFLQKCSSEILQIISKELTYDSELDDLVHTHQNSKFTRVTRKMSRTVTSMTKRIAQGRYKGEALNKANLDLHEVIHIYFHYFIDSEEDQ